MRIYKTIVKHYKKSIMSEYNEKQLRIAKEFRRKQQENKENFEKMKKKHQDAMQEEAQQFDEDKTTLARDLQDVLYHRAELRRKGLSNFSEEMQRSFAEENAIHEKQRNNRRAFFDKRNAHKREIHDLFENCCGTGQFLRNLELEQLAQVDKEYHGSKEENVK